MNSFGEKFYLFISQMFTEFLFVWDFLLNAKSNSKRIKKWGIYTSTELRK